MLFRHREEKKINLFAEKKSSKLHLDAGLKSVEIGQFFITHDAEEGPDEMNNSCREYTSGTKIGPVLD